MVDDNNNQQAHLSSFKHYVQHLGEAKKSLEELTKTIEKKQITDVKKFYEQIESLHTKHSSNCYTASGHYGAGNLHEISGCSSDLNEYTAIVSKLYKLKDEYYKKLKASQCESCKKTNLVNPLVHETNSVTGVKTVFCNQTCLNNHLKKQSGYTRKSKQFQNPKEKQETQQVEKEKNANNNSEKENLLTCPQCSQSITGEWVWYEDKANDNLNFCSEKCCDNYYEINGYCDGCGNVVFQQPYQWITWENLPEEESYYYGTSVKKLVEYYETQLNKVFSKDYSKKYCLSHCFCLNNGINVDSWSGEDLKTYLEWVNEQVNLDQESKNQRIKESKNQRIKESKNQRIKESKNQRIKDTQNSTSNPNNNLKNQINSLTSEIKDLESNQNNKNLLNAKKAELEELKKELNTQTQQNTQNNSKLYLGIGLGVLGGGIIGMVLWLVFRNKKKV